LPRFAALHGCTMYATNDLISCTAVQSSYHIYAHHVDAYDAFSICSLAHLCSLPCCLAVLCVSLCLQVELECLNSVAPPPLNWHMWCPGKDAVVKGWTDKSGAAHRSITLRPQKNMTSTMITWFITAHVLGLMPPVVEHQGNVSGRRRCCRCCCLLMLPICWCSVCCCTLQDAVQMLCRHAQACSSRHVSIGLPVRS
jgi:hypothetical protein